MIEKLKFYKFYLISVNLLSDYLSSRDEIIQIYGNKSELRNIQHRVPQGSITGPLPFLFFNNDQRMRLGMDLLFMQMILLFLSHSST